VVWGGVRWLCPPPPPPWGGAVRDALMAGLNQPLCSLFLL
jgi:hypothetical protein